MHLRRLTAALLLLVSFGTRALAGDEHWQVLQIGGADAGYVHSLTSPGDAPGEFITAVDTYLKLERLGRAIEIRADMKQWENVAGQIVRLEQKNEMSTQVTQAVGVVDDGKLQLTTTVLGKEHKATIDWPTDVPGSEEQRRRLLATGFKEGSALTFWQFQPELGQPIQATTTMGGLEEVQLPAGKQRLYRTVTQLGGLPDVVGWIDDRGDTLKTSTAMMGLQIDTLECDAARIAALKSGASGGAPVEVFAQSVIRSNVRLPRPRALTSLLYRITPKTKGDALPDFAADERQEVVSKDAATGALMLKVRTLVPPENRRQQRPLADPSPELAEFLEPNSMLQSDDPEILSFAAQAVGDETDAWRAAQALELAVDRKIANKSMDVAFATAAETIRTCEGDCSEHAVLLAAAARAAGIPSRVAMGLVYVGGIFGGHAWTEVSIDGKWYALDATLGRGSADPTHLRLGVTSLKGGAFGNMITGMMQGFGKMDLFLVEGARGDTVIRFDRQQDNLELKDGRVVDHIEDLSFALPEGFTLAPLPPSPGGADIFRKSTIATLKNGADVTLDVISRAVPPDYDLTQFGNGDAPGVRRRIAGRYGVVVRGEKLEAAVLVDDTLYEVHCSASDDDATEAFEGLVSSLTVG